MMLIQTLCGAWLIHSKSSPTYGIYPELPPEIFSDFMQRRHAAVFIILLY